MATGELMVPCVNCARYRKSHRRAAVVMMEPVRANDRTRERGAVCEDCAENRLRYWSAHWRIEALPGHEAATETLIADAPAVPALVGS